MINAAPVSTKPEIEEQSETRFEKRWVRGWLLLTLALYLRQLYVLAIKFVDVPFGDEWELYRVHPRYSPFSWAGIFEFHNEHRMIWTNMLTTLFAHFGALNYVWMGINSFAIYGVLVILVYVLGRKIGIAAKYLAPFMIFFVSTSAIENFYWTFQSAFHFVFIFFFTALIVFDPGKWSRSLLAILFAGCAIFSMSAGVMLAMGLSVATLALPALKNSRPADRRTAYSVSIATFIGVGIFIYAWATDYSRVPGANPYVWPIHWRFWQHYLCTLSWISGFPKVNDAVTAVTTIIIGVACFHIVQQWRHGEKTLSLWKVSAFTGSQLLAIGIISLGRASYGGGQGKAGRYAEIVMMLVPSAVWGFSQVANIRKRQWALLGLWLVMLIGHRNDFSYDFNYSYAAESRLRARDCVLNSPSGVCPLAYPNGSISDHREVARTMGAHFMRVAPAHYEEGTK